MHSKTQKRNQKRRAKKTRNLTKDRSGTLGTVLYTVLGTVLYTHTVYIFLKKGREKEGDATTAVLYTGERVG